LFDDEKPKEEVVNSAVFSNVPSTLIQFEESKQEEEDPMKEEH
jgi:hypothetical protein